MAISGKIPSFGWKMQRAKNAVNVGEIYIYDDIVAYESWWNEDGITPKKFREDLDALGDVSQINVFINSNGGDVFAGQAIHSQLARHKAQIHVYVDGLAASIASVIAMAADKLIMPANAQMMIHNPWTAYFDFLAGNADYFRNMAEEFSKVATKLDVIRESLIAAYMKRCKVSKDELIAMLDAETWLPADKCMELGFCDEIEESKKIAASLRGAILVVDGKEFDISRFHNRPNVEVVATVEPVVEPKAQLPTVALRCEDDTFIVVADERDVGVLGTRDAIMTVLDAGRVLSKDSEDTLRNARDLINSVLDKVAKDENEPDSDPDDKVDMVVAELKPDERIDTLLAEVKSLREEVAKVAAFSNAQVALQNVVTPANEVKPSPVEGEDAVVDEHVVELEDAADEVDIDDVTLKQAIKAAVGEAKAELDEKRADWKLRNTGKVD